MSLRRRAEAGSGLQRIIPPSSSSGQAASQKRPQPGHCRSSSHSARSTTGHCITLSSSTRDQAGRLLHGQELPSSKGLILLLLVGPVESSFDVLREVARHDAPSRGGAKADKSDV